jgi:hypothetical protein
MIPWFPRPCPGRRRCAGPLRTRQAAPEGRPGRRPLLARRHADAVGVRAGGPVRRQPHDGQPRAARNCSPKAWSSARRAWAPSRRGCTASAHADRARPARGDRGARPPPPDRGAPAARREGRGGGHRAAGPGHGAPVFPHAVIVHLEDGVPLQCEDRWVNPAESPATWTPTSPAPRRPRCCSRPRRCGARSTPSSPSRPHGAGSGAAEASAPTSPAWWCTAAPSPAIAPSPSRGWCTRAALQLQGSSSHDVPGPPKRSYRPHGG